MVLQVTCKSLLFSPLCFPIFPKSVSVNEYFHLYTGEGRGTNYLKKKTVLLYCSLSSILTVQDGEVPRIYKLFFPLWLWLTCLLTNYWLFSQEIREIKQALTSAFIKFFAAPYSCPAPPPLASSHPPSLPFFWGWPHLVHGWNRSLINNL